MGVGLATVMPHFHCVTTWSCRIVVTHDQNSSHKWPICQKGHYLWMKTMGVSTVGGHFIHKFHIKSVWHRMITQNDQCHSVIYLWMANLCDHLQMTMVQKICFRHSWYIVDDFLDQENLQRIVPNNKISSPLMDRWTDSVRTFSKQEDIDIEFPELENSNKACKWFLNLISFRQALSIRWLAFENAFRWPCVRLAAPRYGMASRLTHWIERCEQWMRTAYASMW